MPDKNEIEKRKLIAKELKLKAMREFENNLPMSKDIFLNLFNYLDEQLSEVECNHDLKLTTNFLNSVNIENTNVVTDWLKDKGCFCDCEVINNVEEKFEDGAIL